MVEWIDWSAVDTVVEYGPGTGAFTRAILNTKPERCRFLAIEFSPILAADLAARYPQVQVVTGSVEDIVCICDEHGIARIDAVVCGLPWSIWTPSLQRSIMRATRDMLSERGYFTTFAYLQGLLLPGGRAFTRLLDEVFPTVQRSRVVWRNLPPAFAYRCRP
ncbi:MAG: ribosomal RNA adenine dimethylase domain-containing protein [Phycisphaera sp.]|nr:ribosomal RNA adenine dimethylase domain-containing protein [Phycisphaera sp.]